MKVEFEHSLNDRVRIIALETVGRVVEMSIGQDGLNYRVRYWWNGDAHSVWLFGDELTKPQ